MRFAALTHAAASLSSRSRFASGDSSSGGSLLAPARRSKLDGSAVGPGQPGSGGRTIMPSSSIHTTFGMFTTPKRVAIWWVWSTSDGCSGCAASM